MHQTICSRSDMVPKVGTGHNPQRCD